ncbi:MAG: CDP-alcohol phosphatidyltransferase [Rhodospirillaceae bacterium]|nr:CDP-alcohol phosphatidyltransferase [Rhodospirillaceae bacterium]|tara:strand:- start:3612 stop:4187 length:576 start_codon:yes stop_codon:yes gene_type:complete
MKSRQILISLPNLISLARLFAVPLMVWLIVAGELSAAFWVFVAASISDAVDGFIAKRFDAVTTFGSYIDPLADKALLVSCFVALGIEGQIANWLVILVVFRDVVIIGGAILALPLGRPVIMRPLFISKLNTTMQIILVALVLAEIGIGVYEANLILVMQYIVAMTTIASGTGYAYRYVTAINSARQDNGQI